MCPICIREALLKGELCALRVPVSSVHGRASASARSVSDLRRWISWITGVDGDNGIPGTGCWNLSRVICPIAKTDGRSCWFTRRSFSSLVLYFNFVCKGICIAQLSFWLPELLFPNFRFRIIFD